MDLDGEVDGVSAVICGDLYVHTNIFGEDKSTEMHSRLSLPLAQVDANIHSLLSIIHRLSLPAYPCELAH